MERTLVLLKPDAVQRGLVGKILTRFEEKGLKLVGLKLRKFPEELIKKHYEVHKERPFYAGLVRFMTSSAVLAVALEGKNAVTVTRTIMGKTNCAEAQAGTIRGDYGMSFSYNLVHGSDALETAQSELALFFDGADELVDWTPNNESWVYDVEDELS